MSSRDRTTYRPPHFFVARQPRDWGNQSVNGTHAQLHPHFTRTRLSRERLIRCHGDALARPAPPRAFGLKKHTSRPLVSRAWTRCASLRLRHMCARCALMPALSMSTAEWIAFGSAARSKRAATHRQPFTCGRTRRVAGGMRDAVRDSSARTREN